MIIKLSLIGEYLMMAYDALKSHKLRSFLTTLGIFLGVTTIITIWTTIQGLNNYIGNTLSEIGSSVVYVEKFPWVIQGDFWEYRNRKDITWNEYKAIERYCSLADYVTPQVVSQRTVGYKENKFDNIWVLGTTEDCLETSDLKPATGRFLTALDVRNRVPVVVLGADLVEKLFENENPISQHVKIDGERYTVVGTLAKRGDFFGQSRDNYAIVPIGNFQNVYGGHRGLQIAVKTVNSDDLPDLKDQLRGVLRKERKVKPGDKDDFSINEQDQLTSFYTKTTSTLYGIIIVIGAISLLVGGIGITNIMLVSVTERTREIGLRKAVGASGRNIRSQFLIESIAIASLGGVIGILIGMFLGSLILSAMNAQQGITISSIFVGFGFSAFVGVISGFYPAYKASKMNPIDSLRYE